MFTKLLKDFEYEIMKNLNIFLIISILLKQQFQFCEGFKSTRIYQQPNEYFGLYDYFQRRFENLQNNKLNPLSVGSYKRSLNGEYIPLYDEFRRRLDNFNAAFLVEMDLSNYENKKPFHNPITNSQLKTNTFGDLGQNQPLNTNFPKLFSTNKSANKKMGNQFKKAHKQKMKSKHSKKGKNNFLYDMRRLKMAKENQNYHDASK